MRMPCGRRRTAPGSTTSPITASAPSSTAKRLRDVVSAQVWAYGARPHRLQRAYATLDNDALRSALRSGVTHRIGPSRLRVATEAIGRADGHRVELDDGTTIRARLVVDATGWPARFARAGAATRPRLGRRRWVSCSPKPPDGELGQPTFMDFRRVVGPDGAPSSVGPHGVTTFCYSLPVRRRVARRGDRARRPTGDRADRVAAPAGRPSRPTSRTACSPMPCAPSTSGFRSAVRARISISRSSPSALPPDTSMQPPGSRSPRRSGLRPGWLLRSRRRSRRQRPRRRRLGAGRRGGLAGVAAANSGAARLRPRRAARSRRRRGPGVLRCVLRPAGRRLVGLSPGGHLAEGGQRSDGASVPVVELADATASGRSESCGVGAAAAAVSRVAST